VCPGGVLSCPRGVPWGKVTIGGVSVPGGGGKDGDVGGGFGVVFGGGGLGECARFEPPCDAGRGWTLTGETGCGPADVVAPL
jgi:hypothetical protein